MHVTSTALGDLEATFEAFNRADPEPLIRAYADDDVILVGTDAHEWHERHDAIAEVLRAEAGAVTADYEMRELGLGPDAAVVVGRMVFALPDGTTIPARATYALRREDAGWRIVHTHLSTPRGV
jgi:hypothetical protein